MYDLLTRASFNGLQIVRHLTSNDELLTRFEREFIAARALRNRPRVEYDEPIPIRRVELSEIDPREFRRALWTDPRPLVIRGLAEDCPAVRDWTPEYFCEHYGDVKLPLSGKKAYVTAFATLREYVGQIRAAAEGGPPPLYAANIADIFRDNPELLEALPMDAFERLMGQRSIGAQLFFGTQQNRTFFHCANVINLFTMIQGEKEWTFIDPKDTIGLLPINLHPELVYAACRVDPQAPDTEKWPLYRYIPKYRARLEPGDVLLNPAWWWHDVRNRSPITIGVAARWTPFRLRWTRASNPLFNLLQWLTPFQWRTLVDWNLRGELRDEHVILRLGNKKNRALKEDRGFFRRLRRLARGDESPAA